MGSGLDDKRHLATAGEGEVLWFNGALVTILVPGAWSEEQFSLAAVAMPRGRATALHTDPSDETLHVIEGEFLLHMDGEDRRIEANSTAAIRRGVPHAFLAVSDIARLLVLNTPGSHDRFFREGGVPAEHRDFDKAPPPDHERTAAAARQVGVELLGPPPFPDGTVRLMSG